MLKKLYKEKKVSANLLSAKKVAAINAFFYLGAVEWSGGGTVCVPERLVGTQAVGTTRPGNCRCSWLLHPHNLMRHLDATNDVGNDVGFMSCFSWEPLRQCCGTFAWIRIRNSENSKLDPDTE